MTTIKKIQLKDGSTRWRFVVDVEPFPNGERRQVTRTYRTKTEAQDALAQIRVDVNAGEFVAPAKITVKEFLESWLAAREGIRESTRATYRLYLAPAIEAFGSVQLQRLTASHVNRLKNDMKVKGGKKGKGSSPRTINAMLTVLSMGLDAARKQRITNINAASSDLVERISEAGKPTKEIWTPEQVQQFLGHVRNDRYIAAWRLTFLGMRRSEILGLTWGAIDLETGTVTVKQSRTPALTKEGPSTVVGDPKTANSRRTIPIPNEVLTDLKAFKRQQQKERLAVGKALTEDDFVVVDEAGTPVYPQTYSVMFWEHSKAAGLPLIELRAARTTTATLMHVAYSLPPAVAAAFLGHTTATYFESYVKGTTGFDQVNEAMKRMQGSA